MAHTTLNVEGQSLPTGQHLRNVAEGRYGLPEFQRTFVWDHERVLRLWDSLYKGYPVGQIMLWVPDSSDFPMRSFGRDQREVAGNNQIAVVDGQQRLTAMYLVLTGDIPLRFNLEREEFTFREGTNDLRLDILRGGEGQPVPFARAMGGYFNRHATPAQRDSFGESIDWLNNILTLRQLPHQKIMGADYGAVLGVFERLNRQGEPLNEAQITMAGVSRRWPGVFRRTYDLLRKMNVEMGFDGEEDPTFVFQVWTAVHTEQHLIKHLATGAGKYASLATEKNYEVSWDKTVGGVEKLIEIMRDKLDLTNFRFVKAYYPLAVAAHFLATHPDASAADRETLTRWLILAILSERFSVRGTSRYAGDIKATAAGDGLKRLFQHKREPLDPQAVTSGVLDERNLLQASFRSPYVTLLYMVMRRLRAVDWGAANSRVGEELKEGAWHFHHIFPHETFDGDRQRVRDQIEEANDDGDEAREVRLRQELDALETRVKSLANLAFLAPSTNIRISNRQPADYLAEIASTNDGKATLDAQLIPLDPALWKHSAFEDFRRERCRLLVARAREFFFMPVGGSMAAVVPQSR